MARSNQRVLLIGDTYRELAGAVMQAIPGATVRHASSVFDGIAELAHDRYSAILAAAEPVARRPEAAVRTLRELAGEGRLVLFGDPSLEPLSRKMLEFGCDDYLITPVTATQIKHALTGADGEPLRLHTDYDTQAPRPKPKATRKESPVSKLETPPAPKMDSTEMPAPIETAEPTPSGFTDPAPMSISLPAGGASIEAAALLSSLPVGEILLGSLLEHPGEVITFAVKQLNARLAADGWGMTLSYVTPPANSANSASAPAAPAAALPADRTELTYDLTATAGPRNLLVLQAPTAQKEIGQSLLAALGSLLGSAALIQQRQARLQKLAFTDDLTGLYNCRYFKHFLGRILGESRKLRFPVTLFLFDIDNFKSYNDHFGHGVGDDILKQTANLMRRCVRDHDLVARIGGDEFAVIFWEKDGPRTPRDTSPGQPGRPPSEPQQILERFRRLLETENFPLLGSTGRGSLTISGGLAVYPWDAQEMGALIEAADKALMFGAKRGGRNSIQLVGGERPAEPTA